MTALLLKFAPWLAGVILLVGIGSWIGYEVNPYKTKYKDLQAADWQAKAQGEVAAKEALAKQLVQAQRVSQNNSEAMQRLNNENAQTLQDRDAVIARVHRLEQLLSAQAARAASGAQVPATGSRPGPASAGGDPGIGRAGELLIAARDECKRNASRLNALIAEVNPQLEIQP
jgi:hypothetical protein